MALPMTSDRVLDSLRRHGRRITGPKRAVVDVLVQSDGHLSAEDVAAAMVRILPDVSLSTVYRILEELETYGLIEHTHSGHGPASYQLAGRAHGHVTCSGCGVTLEVPGEFFDRLAADLESALAFRLDPHHVALSGMCAACARV